MRDLENTENPVLSEMRSPLLTEFWTPAKVALLFCIRHYCTQHFSANQISNFVQFYVRYVSAEPTTINEPSLYEILKDFCLTVLNAEQNQLQRNHLGETILFLSEINTVDKLREFVRNFRHCLLHEASDDVIAPVHEYSLLGTFIQKAIFTFKSLSLDELLTLNESYCAAICDAAVNMTSVNIGPKSKESWNMNHFDSDDDDMDTGDKSSYGDMHVVAALKQIASQNRPLNSMFLLSLDYVHRFIDYGSRMVHNLDSMPKESYILLRKHVLMLSSLLLSYPRLQYILYQLYIFEGNFEASLSTLHRLFDYSLTSHHTLHVQYASLTLASLYSHFNRQEESRRAVQEAIHAARLRHDHACLALALHMSHSIENAPELAEKRLLDALSLVAHWQHVHEEKQTVNPTDKDKKRKKDEFLSSLFNGILNSTLTSSATNSVQQAEYLRALYGMKMAKNALLNGEHMCVVFDHLYQCTTLRMVYSLDTDEDEHLLRFSAFFSMGEYYLAEAVLLSAVSRPSHSLMCAYLYLIFKMHDVATVDRCLSDSSQDRPSWWVSSDHPSVRFIHSLIRFEDSFYAGNYEECLSYLKQMEKGPLTSDIWCYVARLEAFSGNPLFVYEDLTRRVETPLKSHDRAMVLKLLRDIYSNAEHSQQQKKFKDQFESYCQDHWINEKTVF